jgi:hypothetical protein
VSTKYRCHRLCHLQMSLLRWPRSGGGWNWQTGDILIGRLQSKVTKQALWKNQPPCSNARAETVEHHAAKSDSMCRGGKLAECRWDAL